MGALVLGDQEKNITPPVVSLGIVYLDGAIWAVAQASDGLYKINPDTGAEILHYNLGFQMAAITTDGTNLYVSTDVVGNGTIFKVSTLGVILSKFTVIPVTTGILSGLAWDGTSLWATMDQTPNSLFRINPTTYAIETTISVEPRFGDICWYDNLIWAVDWQDDKVRAINPTSGRIIDTFDSITGFGDFGLTDNGTHLLQSEWSSNVIGYLDYPTAIGETWNSRPAPGSHSLGLDWNGTHYFIADGGDDQIYIIHDGTYEITSNFSVPYNPLGIAVIGNFIYVSSDDSPWSTYKYSMTGGLLGTYASIGIELDSLAYDGTNLWAVGDDNNMYKISITDGTMLANYTLGDYSGLTYDSRNKVFWATNWVANIFVQLNPTDFSLTGINHTSPTSNGEYGIVFNGEHIVIVSWDTDLIYKVIIYVAPVPGGGGGIPGFELYLVLFPVLLLLGIVFLRRRKNSLL